MAVIMGGPSALLAKAFSMARWRTIQVDKYLCIGHDLSDTAVQLKVRDLLEGADFIWASLDDSAKAINHFAGRISMAPKPWRCIG